MKRCPWCEKDEMYVKYHDEEWGVPIHEDNRHFEFLILEAAQAGLSWLTVLRKRDNYRKAYDNFDPVKVAKYDEEKINELINNPGIIRNRRKIEASVNNAQRFLEIQREFGSFNNYLWGFVNNEIIKNEWDDISQVPANTNLSSKISKDLKKRGFRFVGSTVIYSYLQAAGLVNDHIKDCFRYNDI